MGDYTKLIVNCAVSGVTKEEIEAKILELGPSTSAYHCGGEFWQVKKEEYISSDRYNISIICQTKYGKGQEDFLDWLAPVVVDAIGTEEIYAIQFWEWGRPKFHCKSPKTDKQIQYGW